MELLNDFFKTYNCWGMPTGNTTCQMGGWFRREIKRRRVRQWRSV
jgi:TRAP-type mannitol/chloroaromatic compound transport system substrate-binding protein